jgi:hypothetical protein
MSGFFVFLNIDREIEYRGPRETSDLQSQTSLINVLQSNIYHGSPFLFLPALGLV